MYLHEIRRGLLHIDSEDNFDSEYYVNLAVIVLAALKLYKNYLDLVYCFFHVLPKELDDSGVAFLARQIGLHALNINYLEGDLEVPPKVSEIDLAAILTGAERIKRTIGTEYGEQRRALLGKLLGYIAPRAAPVSRSRSRSRSRVVSISRRKFGQSSKLAGKSIIYSKTRNKGTKRKHGNLNNNANNNGMLRTPPSSPSRTRKVRRTSRSRSRSRMVEVAV